MGVEIDTQIKQAIELTTNQNRANIAFLIDLPTRLFAGFNRNDVFTELRKSQIYPTSIHPIISLAGGVEEITQSIFRPSTDALDDSPVTIISTDIQPASGGDLFSYEFAFRTEPIILNGKKHYMYGARASINTPGGGFLLLNLFPVIDKTDLISPFSTEEVFADSYDEDYRTKYKYERTANIFGQDRTDMHTRIPSKTSEKLIPIYFNDCLLLANGIYRDGNNDFYEFEEIRIGQNYELDFIFSNGMVEHSLDDIINLLPANNLLRRHTDPQMQQYLADLSPFMDLLNPQAKPLECALTALPEFVGGRSTSHLDGRFDEMIVYHVAKDEAHAQSVRASIHSICIECVGDILACKRPRPTREIINFTQDGMEPNGQITLSTRARFNKDQGLYDSIIPKKK
jgi:hypothetical protein